MTPEILTMGCPSISFASSNSTSFTYCERPTSWIGLSSCWRHRDVPERRAVDGHRDPAGPADRRELAERERLRGSDDEELAGPSALGVAAAAHRHVELLRPAGHPQANGEGGRAHLGERGIRLVEEQLRFLRVSAGAAGGHRGGRDEQKREPVPHDLGIGSGRPRADHAKRCGRYAYA
jgi:hypothetical protein